MNKDIAAPKGNTIRDNLLRLAREHVHRQMSAGFSAVPDFDSLVIIRCADGSVQGRFDNIVNMKEVVSVVALSADEANSCDDGPMPPSCDGVINLANPVSSERVRDFQPPWRTVFHYRCPKCGGLHRVRANSYAGRRAVPGVGAIVCGR